MHRALRPIHSDQVEVWRFQFLLLLLNVRVLGRFFFFFQAEDGIRDATVTGVQTCALPISSVMTCCDGPSPTARWMSSAATAASPTAAHVCNPMSETSAMPASSAPGTRRVAT